MDCTCTVNDSLDLLAEFMGVGSSVASITSSAMDGTMALEDALEERLRIINCSPQVSAAATPQLAEPEILELNIE